VSRHLADLLVRERRKEAALHETAVDLVCRNPIADDLAALERHRPKLHRLVGTVAPGDRLQVAAVAIDDLAAVATGRAETDPLCLQHDDRISPFAELQCRRDPGEAGSDDADIRLDLPLQLRPDPLVVGGSRIP